MEREVLAEDLKKLYKAGDMVKADCGAARDVPSAAGAWGTPLNWTP